MKVLIIGGSGQLGSSLIALLHDEELICPNREEMDLSSSSQIRNYISKEKPDFVINCAAFHNVPLCEEEYQLAFNINSFAVNELSKACVVTSSNLITFSTDYVFDGKKENGYTEFDSPNPLQAYGTSKLAGEQLFKNTPNASGYIIRTSSLYGGKGSKSKKGNFVLNRISDLENNKISKIEMSNELVMCPTFSNDLAEAVVKVLKMGKIDNVQTLHLACEGTATWADFTREIYKGIQAKVEVIGVDRKGVSGTMRRPLNSVLINRVAKDKGISLPEWKHSLKKYLVSLGYPIELKRDNENRL